MCERCAFWETLSDVCVHPAGHLNGAPQQYARQFSNNFHHALLAHACAWGDLSVS